MQKYQEYQRYTEKYQYYYQKYQGNVSQKYLKLNEYLKLLKKGNYNGLVK